MVKAKPKPKPIKKADHIDIQNGYRYGKAPSEGALKQESRVEAALLSIGGTHPQFLEWNFQEFLTFLQGIEFPRKVSLEYWLDSTLNLVGNSHPHITSWEQLNCSQIIDFLLGVDIALNIKGQLMAFDVTANPEAVTKKEEKVLSSFRGARQVVLKALGFKHYIIVLVPSSGDISLKSLVFSKTKDFVYHIDLR